jgi:tripartite-type tricarboxylate transporter receptor subunit TctC
MVKQRISRRTALKRAASVAALCLHELALAQPGSGKPIRIIVPFAPGGSGDITARLLADYLTRKTSQSVVVENKPGANGIIGVEAAKRSPADGSVLLLATTSTHLANPSLYKALPYDPEKDFSLVGHFGGGSMLVLARPAGPYKTLNDLVTAARANPDKLNYGHFNASSHIPGAMIGQIAGIKLTPVPYKQIGNAMTDLISGQLDVIFVDSVAGDSYAASGQLRAIAAHGQQRLPKYPNVPLIAETYPGYNVSAGMLGIAVPKGTPLAVQQALNDLINDAITTDPMKGSLQNFGFHPKAMTLAELAAFVSRDRALWKEQVALAGIEPQ